MKILYFFELYEGNLIKYYNFLKKKELERIRYFLKKKFNKENLKIEFYCLNKDNEFLKKNRYEDSIKSILSEYLNIERKSYKKIVDQALIEIKRFFESLTKPNLPKTKNILNILEYTIKHNLHEYLEQIIFIDSIIKRKKPKLILISQSSPHIIKTFVNRTKYPIKKILFFKSKLNNLFFKIKDIISFFYGIFYKILKKFRIKIKKIYDLKHNDFPLIGICPPSFYLSSAIEPVYKELINQKINVKIFENRILIRFPFVSNPSFKELKYQYTTFYPSFKELKYQYITFIRVNLFLNKLWKSKKYIDKLFRFIDNNFKDSFHYILKYELKLNLDKNIYRIKNIENEVKSFNYKVIVILNEFEPVGKIICMVCKKYNIPVYFTSSVGIPNDGSEITPYLCDMINVDGDIDKQFLSSNGVDSNKIVVRGSPKYEMVMKRKLKTLSNVVDLFTRKRHSLSDKKKKILLAVNPIPKASNEVILTTVINVLKKLKNIQLIIKLHPRQSGIFIKNLMSRLDYNAIIVKSVDIFDIINSCDILLTQDSAVILDSMVVGTPLISMDLVNKRLYYSGFYNYNDEKYIYKVYDGDQLYDRLQKLLDNPKVYTDYKNLLRKNLSSILYIKENYSPTEAIVSDLRNFYFLNSTSKVG